MILKNITLCWLFLNSVCVCGENISRDASVKKMADGPACCMYKSESRLGCLITARYTTQAEKIYIAYWLNQHGEVANPQHVYESQKSLYEQQRRKSPLLNNPPR